MLPRSQFAAATISLLALPFGSEVRAQSVEIDKDRVERIVTTLASDDMQGRRTFTDGIDKAAAFIESEFAEIGLDTLAGLVLEIACSMSRTGPKSSGLPLQPSRQRGFQPEMNSATPSRFRGGERWAASIWSSPR